MRKFQKATAAIMVAALTATGCSAGGTKTSTPQQPPGTEAIKTDAAAGAGKTEAARDTAPGEGKPVLVVHIVGSETLNSAVIPGFEKDTGIKVEVVVAGTGELLKRTQSEKDNPLGDIFWIADQAMLSSSKELFTEYISPEDKNMLDASRNTIGYFTPALTDPTVMVVDKDLKDDMKIDGLEDLLNPELKGKIVFGNPINSSSAFQSLLTMLHGIGKDGDPLSDQAWDYVDQLIVNLDSRIADSSSQVYKGVAGGEYVVGLIQEDPAASYVKEDVAVGVVFPREDIIFPGEFVQILGDCRHPGNMKKFVDYILSEKVQNAAGSNLIVRPLRKDAKLADYVAPQFEIKLFDSYSEGWMAEHETEITNPFSEYMETSMG